MKSAYSVLGIPGNAGSEEIEEAFLRGSSHYSGQRLVADPKAIDKLVELREAHKLLTNPELRAAHDRKLSAARNSSPPQARVVIEKEETPWFSKPLNLIALAVIFMFASGGYMSYSRMQERKEQAVREIAQQKLDAEAALKAERMQEQAEAARARQMAENDRREQQLRRDSSAVASIASYSNVQREANAQRDSQRQAQEAKNEERQRAADAARRLAQDKQRIRELCYQNYRRYDC
jgi:curved DNA-binding protein CbpA